MACGDGRVRPRTPLGPEEGLEENKVQQCRPKWKTAWVEDSLCVHRRNPLPALPDHLPDSRTPWLSASACRSAAGYCLPPQPSLVHSEVLEKRGVGLKEWLLRTENKSSPLVFGIRLRRGRWGCRSSMPPLDFQIMSSSKSWPPVQCIAGIELELCSCKNDCSGCPAEGYLPFYQP